MPPSLNASAPIPRAFSKFSTTRIWIDPSARLMVVGAGSIARADEAVGMLMQCLRAIDNPFAATLVNTATAPSTGMSIWLSEREAPAGFSIDRECELRQAQAAGAAGTTAQGDEGPTAAQQAAESKATVRYSRHDLDIDEIVAHIAQGKVATIYFCMSTYYTCWDRALSMLASGKVQAEPIITHELPLSRWQEGFDAIENMEALKVILIPE